MRRFLDGLYLVAGYASAAFLAGIAVTILAQVGGRLAGFTIDSTETAGFCLAASTFLGLAYTMKRGGHIRVNLVIRYFGGTAKKLVELWCIGFATIALAYFTWWSIDFVYYSYVFKEISPGLMAVPFWIPRSGMALGLLIVTVAMADEFLLVLRGAEPSYEANAETILPSLHEEEQNDLRGRQAPPGAPIVAGFENR